MLPASPEFVEVAADVDMDVDLGLDGELVTFRDGRLDFAALQQRARCIGCNSPRAAARRDGICILTAAVGGALVGWRNARGL
ncbi:hypothetical protein CP975_11580 [Streptomyces alboniger]|uniref:ATP-dependent DNA ligase family profile domain-containing protein n=1 Tax=Streptomyces alboniger TaxID=132473 RepID=A0A5J6HFN7_STRAD|nr:hypothetical protein CP975_11580 [Streptomyces alboniger]